MRKENLSPFKAGFIPEKFGIESSHGSCLYPNRAKESQLFFLGGTNMNRKALVFAGALVFGLIVLFRLNLNQRRLPEGIGMIACPNNPTDPYSQKLCSTLNKLAGSNKSTEEVWLVKVSKFGGLIMVSAGRTNDPLYYKLVEIDTQTEADPEAAARKIFLWILQEIRRNPVPAPSQKNKNRPSLPSLAGYPPPLSNVNEGGGFCLFKIINYYRRDFEMKTKILSKFPANGFPALLLKLVLNILA